MWHTSMHPLDDVIQDNMHHIYNCYRFQLVFLVAFVPMDESLAPGPYLGFVLNDSQCVSVV